MTVSTINNNPYRNNYDVIIIGGGVAGSATAYHLKHDYKVLIIDTNGIGSQHRSYYVARDVLKQYAYHDPI